MRPWRDEFVGFTENLKFKLRSKERPVDAGNANRWHMAIFLGFCRNTGQFIGYDFEKEFITHARTALHFPDERK